MAKNFALVVSSLALLILSVAALAAATQPARAQNLGPAFSGGDFPLISLEGSQVTVNAPPSVLYTVPAGKRLVVKTLCFTPSQWWVQIDGNELAWNSLFRMNTNYPGLYCSGEGNYVVGPGQSIGFDTVTTSTSQSGYYVFEGVLMTE